jgi:thiaminase/transcriptional activator TenA
VLHDELWTESRDLVEASASHPFVTGLERGTLPAAAFERYVAQDSFYLRAFFRAYALAAAKAERLEHLALFHELLGGALDEMRMHRRYAAELGIELDGVTPLAATRAYVDFLMDLAWHRELGELIAGLAPCMRLYAFLGERLGRAVGGRPDHPYAVWIRTYSDPEFQRLADRHDALLDELAADTAAVRGAYRRAMRCERDFFEAALRGR